MPDHEATIDTETPNEGIKNAPYGLGSSETGACISSYEQFAEEELAVVNDSLDRKTLVYCNDKRFYIKSGETFGNIQLSPSKIPGGSPNMLVRRGELLEKIKTDVSKKLKTTVGFYARAESDFFTPFIDMCLNKANVKCVKAVENGVQKLIPISELDKKSCTFEAILKSGTIKKSSQHNDLVWGLSIAELHIKPLSFQPKVQKDEPKVLFAQKL